MPGLYIEPLQSSHSHLDLQIFEDVDPASPAEVGRGTREGVLLQVKITESYHEPDQPISNQTSECLDVKITVIPLVD